MTEQEIQKIIEQNNRLIFLLGDCDKWICILFHWAVDNISTKDTKILDKLATNIETELGFNRGKND